MRLLLAEDDAELAASLGRDLRQAGYAVDTVHDGEEALFMGSSEPYDVVVLDLGLPGLAGLEVLQQWRSRGVTTPVLILTARGAWHEKVDGFRAGADDYLTKPFHVEELLVRLQALMRRSHGMASGRIEAGDISLDEGRQCAYQNGEEITLTGTEFRLLRYLMLHAGEVVSGPSLIEHVYDDAEDLDSNVIEVYISRLRKKLGKAYIQTRRGQGYVFDTDAACR
jgi:two-component system OmpR family response regulator